MSTPPRASAPRTFGFTRTSTLLTGRIRDASVTRGFSQSRLLTHWEEVAGPDIARISHPVEVSYARGGIGATLVLLTTGPNAPVLEMEKTRLRDRVNAVYGYNAISRIRITQTAPTGFADGQVAFGHAPKETAPKAPPPAAREKAAQTVAPVKDEGLRQALEMLGANIISRNTS